MLAQRHPTSLGKSHRVAATTRGFDSSRIHSELKAGHHPTQTHLHAAMRTCPCIVQESPLKSPYLETVPWLQTD